MISTETQAELFNGALSRYRRPVRAGHPQALSHAMS